MLCKLTILQHNVIKKKSVQILYQIFNSHNISTSNISIIRNVLFLSATDESTTSSTLKKNTNGRRRSKLYTIIAVDFQQNHNFKGILINFKEESLYSHYIKILTESFSPHRRLVNVQCRSGAFVGRKRQRLRRGSGSRLRRSSARGSSRKKYYLINNSLYYYCRIMIIVNVEQFQFDLISSFR